MAEPTPKHPDKSQDSAPTEDAATTHGSLPGNTKPAGNPNATPDAASSGINAPRR